jgi:alpha-mannosidase
MIGNAHLDAVWMWPWEEGYAEVRATFRSALDRMDEDPDVHFTCDSVAYYAWIEEHDAELFERLRRRIADGRWELAGGWWVEPDCNIPGGEALVRQGLYGQLYLRSRFGRAATVGMNVDPFGHPASLPQILAGQGLASYVFFRPLVGEMVLPGALFRWRAPDGTEILAYRIPHEYSSGFEVDDVDDHVASVFAALPGDWQHAMGFFGVGNHGGGPTRANIASVRRLAAAPTGPRLTFSTAERYFEQIRTSVPAESIPLVTGELQHHARGCYSAHSEIKALNRRSELALASAEAWSAIAATGFGVPYPGEDLAHAWRQVAFNQFHDILAGTAVPSAYVTARDQLGEAMAVASRAANRSIQTIVAQVGIADVPGSFPFVVFNPHPWPVTMPVELEVGEVDREATVRDLDGQPVPAQVVQSAATAPGRRRLVIAADLPALGYRAYRVHRGADAPAVSSGVVVDVLDGGIVLDNRLVRAVVDPATGWLAELVDLRSGARLDPSMAGGHAEVIDDASDTWSHDVVAYQDRAGSFAIDSIDVLETGPVRAVVRVEASFGSSRLREDYVLGLDSPFVEVRVELDWHERLRVLKLRVPTGLSVAEATFEIPYGTIRRQASGSEEPGQTWVDVSGEGAWGPAGVSVITDAKYAYDVRDGTVGITAARSPVYAWHGPETLEAGRSYRYLDQGLQQFRYVVMPHAGSWSGADTPRRAQEVNRPPIALLDSAHPGSLPASRSFVECSPAGVLVGALKLAEDGSGDLIVRVIETAGVATMTTIGLPVIGRSIEASLRPNEIRTLRVPMDAGRPITSVDLLEDPS